MTDYPAAHSMDSTWFAVDADGNIAVFDTGEGGCVPEGDFPLGGEAGSYEFEPSDLLARAMIARARTDERLAALLPDNVEELEKLAGEIDFEERDMLLRHLGVWTYDCEEPVAAPYLRRGDVRSPLRLDDLDPETRTRFSRASLPVRFAESPRLAPGEHAAVFAWSAFWLDLEGKPHPTENGRDDYEEEVREYLEDSDIYEDLDEEEAQPPDFESDEEFYDALEAAFATATRREDAPPPPGDPDDKEGWTRWVTGLFKKKG